MLLRISGTPVAKDALLRCYSREWISPERVLLDWRMCKKQQMGWSRAGAQYLLHVKTAIINGRLDRYTGHHSVPADIAAAYFGTRNMGSIPLTEYFPFPELTRKRRQNGSAVLKVCRRDCFVISDTTKHLAANPRYGFRPSSEVTETKRIAKNTTLTR
jgi:hypothetical protein